jgi:hypothetical protein
MKEEKHIIKKAVVELYLPSADNSFDIQNKSLSYFKEYIVPMIEKIVARLSTDRIVRIDKLEFDFQNFKYDEPNEAGLEKLEKKLEEELIRIIADEKNGYSLETITVKKLSAGKRDEELFIHLLINGNLPWWAGSGTSILLKDLAENILEKPDVFFINELRQALSSPAVRKRIAFQLPHAIVEKIITLICEQSGELAGIVNALSGFLPAGIIAPLNFRSLLYKHALRYSQHADVKMLQFIGTLIREELDFQFAEKLYAACNAGHYPGQGTSYTKHIPEDHLSVTTDPAVLSLVIKKALSGNDRYFNGKISQLFNAPDKELFFTQPKDKENAGKAAKETEELKADQQKEKEKEKNTDEEKIKDAQKRGDDPGENNKPGNKKRLSAEELKQEQKKSGKQQDRQDAKRKDTGSDKEEHEDNISRGKKNASGPEQDRMKSDPEKQDQQAEENKKEKANRREDEASPFVKKENKLPGETDPLQLYMADPVEDLMVSNSGVIILTPYLPTFYKALELYDGKEFVSQDALERAVCLLQYLSTGDAENMQEHEMVLNKIICGMEISEPVALQFELTEKEKEECDELLTVVAGKWPALKGTSGEGMRDAFFAREGILEKHANGWNLKIERTTIDILLDRLPWGISIIKLPWSREMIFTNW